MNKILLVFCCIVFFSSCDDGEIIVTSFDFEDQTLQSCGGPENYVFFKLNTDANESLSLSLETSVENFKNPANRTFVLNGTTNFANYRKYNGDITASYFCNNVPPESPQVSVEYVGNSGTVTMGKIVVRDDLDGVEEAIDDDIDTDMDGIPDYYDADDDGDNVLTIIELGTGDEPADTDGDTIPDYLDQDDDNDTILTRYEAEGGLDPTQTDTNGDGIPDYLDDTIVNEDIIDEYILHSYSLQSSINIFISGLELRTDNESIIQESLDLGSIENIVNTTETETPIFN